MPLKATAAPRTLWRFFLPPLVVLAFASGAHAREADQGFFLDLAAVESARIEKAVCQEKHPEFGERNHAAFAAAPHLKETGEEMIGSLASADDRKKLLDRLQQLRAQIRASYDERSPQQLKSVCASYADAIEKMAKDAQAGGKKP